MSFKRIARDLAQTGRRIAPEDRAFEWPEGEIPSAWKWTRYHGRDLIARQARGVRDGSDRIVGPLLGPQPHLIPRVEFGLRTKGAVRRLLVPIAEEYPVSRALWSFLALATVTAIVGSVLASMLPSSGLRSAVTFVGGFAGLVAIVMVPGCLILAIGSRSKGFRRKLIVENSNGAFSTTFRYPAEGGGSTERFNGAPEPVVLVDVLLNPLWTPTGRYRLSKYYPGRWCVLALLIEDVVVFVRFDRELEPIEEAAAEFARDLQTLATPPQEPERRETRAVVASTAELTTTGEAMPGQGTRFAPEDATDTVLVPGRTDPATLIPMPAVKVAGNTYELLKPEDDTSRQDAAAYEPGTRVSAVLRFVNGRIQLVSVGTPPE